MKPREINTVDLFCGAGGATTGLELTLERLGLRHKGLAIDHWRVAVDTMQANHPDVDTKQMSIEEAVPADLVPGGRVDFLWASPSCTHFSRALGGKPRSNQLRAQPELILTWLDQLFVRRLCVENVPEFVEWGPLSAAGRPIEARKGACFRAWIAALEARNYLVEWRVLNCADYGDATTRRRFFLQAVRKGCGRIVWPEPTHAENPEPSLFGPPLKKWRGIRECLDLSDTGTSIFNRRTPLAKNTLRRVFVGLRKFCGLDFQMDFLGADGPDEPRLRSVDEPVATQPAGGNRTALVRPFVVGQNGSSAPHSVNDPCPTVTTTSRGIKVITPLVLGQQSGAECIPADKPAPTIATKGAVRLVEPIVVGMSRPSGPDSGHINAADEPIRTITTFDNLQGCFLMTEDGDIIDVRMRMLKPSELAAAHSFPKDYKLTGNRTEQVKQIGNSVPCRTAAAICEAALSA